MEALETYKKLFFAAAGFVHLWEGAAFRGRGRAWANAQNLLPLSIVKYLFIVFPFMVDAQEKAGRDHFTIEDGLPCLLVEAIMQDKKGFLWLGMEEGLTKFDGYEFKTWFHQPFAEGESPNAPHITALMQDNEGYIWLGTFGSGINRFDPVTETFEYFVHAPEDPGSLSNNYIQALAPDNQGGIWIATNHGLNRLDPKTKKIKRYYFAEGQKRGDDLNNITRISIDKQNTVVAGTASGRLLSVDSGGKTRNLTAEAGLSFFNYPITAILQSEDGKYWIGTSGAGVFVLDENYRLTERIHTNSDPPISSNIVKAIFKEASGIILIGTSENIDFFDPKTRKCKPHFNNPDLPDQRAIHIRSIFQDRSGVIWMGVENGGLHFIKRKKFDNKIKFKVHTRGFYQSDSDQLFIGSEGLGLWAVQGCCEPETQRLIRISSPAFNPKSVHCLTRDKAGFYWVGTNDQGLFRLQLDANLKITQVRQFKRDPADPFSVVHNYIWALYLDKNDRLWVGTKGGFSILNLSDPENQKFINFEYTPDNAFGLLNNEIRSFQIDRENRMWIGTRGGVNRFLLPSDPGELHPSRIKMEQFTHNEKNRTSISSNSLLTILLSKKGEIWLGTAGGGFCKYEPEINGFSHYTTKDGLSNNIVYAILEDDQERLWISTNFGLSLFDPVGKTFTNYSPEEGLQGFEYTGLSALKGPDGEFYFGGGNGFDRFSPEQVTSMPRGSPPPVAFTRFEIFDEKYAEKGANGRSNKNIADRDKITLAYDQNTFSIGFVALDFNSPSKNQYAFQLERYDRDWISGSASSRTATYTKVPPGHYTFRVRASNAEGVWNEQGISLDLIIRPPWWRTNLAYLFYFLSAGLIGYSFFRYQRQRWRLKSELEWEKKEAMKLKELDEVKNRLYTNITHEFRTPLTVITGMADKIREEPARWLDPGIGMIRRNSYQLLDLVNQMLELKKLESGTTKVNMVQGNVISYLAYLSESFDSLAKSKGISLHFLPDTPEVIMDYDREKLLRIVSNLLSNAVKFTPAGGHIYLEIKKPDNPEPGFLQIVVRDTGAGIPADKLPFVFDRFYQADDSPTRRAEGAGIGLTLTREVVRLLGGDIQAESRPGKGSLFTVRLPIEKTAPLHEEFGSKPEFSSEPATETTMPATAPAEDSARPSLLIVEDNADVVQYLQSCLEKEYHLLLAGDGLEGIEKAIEWVPDIIISDVMMPGKDGFELCNTLKNDERTSHIPIILLTAKADSDSVLQGLERGADAYLSKPFDEKELRVRLRKLIELRKKLQARYSAMEVLPPSNDAGIRMEDAFLTKARKMVEDRLDDPNLSLHDLCRALTVSRTQLHNKLKALTGRSASSFIRIIRLQKARELLKATRMNVAEVSYEVGFNDPNYFSRCYAEEFGERPSEKRR